MEVSGRADGTNKRTVALLGLLGLLSDDPGLYRPDAAPSGPRASARRGGVGKEA